MNAHNLESIHIPNSVQILSYSCFQNSGLKSVVIPDSVTEIWEHSFENSTNLVSVQIGCSIRRILRYSFNECKNLTYINILSDKVLIKDHVFTGCHFIRCVHAPPSTLRKMEKYAPKSVFSDSTCPIQSIKVRIIVQ